MTTQIKALNERFKVELFYRKGHQIWLSNTGRAPYDITQGIFAQEEAIELLRESSEFESGVLRIAGVGPFDLMEIVETFSKRYPRPVLSNSVEKHNETLAVFLRFQLGCGCVHSRDYRERHSMRLLRFT